jgi:hypothetical protein
MTKREKLLQKLLALPTEMEVHGFFFSHAGSNHNLFTDGETYINIPTVKGRFVKRVYLIKLVQALGYDQEVT